MEQDPQTHAVISSIGSLLCVLKAKFAYFYNTPGLIVAQQIII